MLSALIKKEFTDLWREGRIKWMLGIILLLLMITVAISYRYTQQLHREHAAAMQADRTVWETQSDKNPHGAAHFGFYLFKPVYPLSIFEPGIDRYIGATIYLEAHKRNSEQYSAVADQSDLARFGYLSPSFILQLLIPLLIIVAGFNIITKEKEHGNLSLLFSQGCSAKQLLRAKWLSLFSLVLMIIIPAFLISMVLLFVQGANIYNYAGAIGMLLLYLAFYALIINVVLYIGNKTRQSARAFLYCIVFWIFSSLVLPRVVNNLAQQTSPLLTNNEITKLVDSLNKSQHREIHAFGAEGYKKLVDSLLKKYKVDTVTKLPVNMAGIRLDVGEQMDTRNYEVVTRLQLKRLHKQQQIITAGSLFSPVIPVQQLSMAIANTDVYSHQHFSDAGEQYRRVFVNRLNRHIAYESGLQEGYTSFKAGADLWKSVPVFQYAQPGASVLSHYWLAALLLFSWLLVSSWALNKSLTHFKPL